MCQLFCFGLTEIEKKTFWRASNTNAICYILPVEKKKTQTSHRCHICAKKCVYTISNANTSLLPLWTLFQIHVKVPDLSLKQSTVYLWYFVIFLSIVIHLSLFSRFYPKMAVWLILQLEMEILQHYVLSTEYVSTK